MAERDTKKPKTVREWVNDRRPVRSTSVEFEKRRRQWEALSAFVTGEGGWVTSLPGVIHLRVEVPQGSALPAKLIELGYSVRAAGSGTRITPRDTIETITAHSTTGKPIIRHHPGFQNIDIIEITLEG
jgi:hypothetical protein